MANPIRKAIIPAAGLGTRFLPASKTVPKELFPIVDRPIILHVVEEAVAAGIEDIILVAGRGKSAVEDFFDISFELEHRLSEKPSEQTEHFFESMQRIRSLANIITIRQKQRLGLGHAVLCARHVIGDEPFAVLLADEIMVPRRHSQDPGVTALLAKIYNDTGKSAVAVMEVPSQDVVKYGIADVIPCGDSLFTVRSLVEKPSVEKAPSRFALPGRYVFDSSIFRYLQETKPSRSNEIQLTDAMDELAKREGILATTFTARRYDAGDKVGFLRANIELALERPELRSELKQYLISLCQTNFGSDTP